MSKFLKANPRPTARPPATSVMVDWSCTGKRSDVAKIEKERWFFALDIMNLHQTQKIVKGHLPSANLRKGGKTFSVLVHNCLL